MSKCFWVMLLFSVSLQIAQATTVSTFSEAKQLAKIIHRSHSQTFYCQCRYDKHGKVNLQSCGYKIQGDKRRAHKLEWEHIVPVSLWGKHLPCWQQALCCNQKVCYKGRSCCRKSDPKFSAMEADLHNIVPESGELNRLRSNYRFDVLPFIREGQLGACEIKIDPETRCVEPPPRTRGIIARAYLYMADTYGISLSKRQQRLYTLWNAQYPPDDWEIEWDKRVACLQGNHNLYILNYERQEERNGSGK